MKKTVLFLITLVTFIGYAQAPITDFFSIPMSSYAIVESTPAIDQSVSGTDLTWNYTNFTATGTNIDTYAAPNAGELTSYPGTTEILTITTSGGGNNKIYGKDITGTVSLTGAEATDIDLNYSNDNALIGSFPLSYGFDNTDNVSGTFSSSFASGTFTGTIDVNVDAYGTLNMNDVGEGSYSGSVTRLKVVQNLTLSITTPFPVNAPATQTSYYYYDDTTNNLVFRTNNIVVDLIGVDETVMESFLEITLSTEQNTLADQAIQIFPNPVSNVLYLNSSALNTVEKITIVDLNGSLVLSSKSANTAIDVSALQSGLYLVVVQSKNGLSTKKFIKK